MDVVGVLVPNAQVSEIAFNAIGYQAMVDGEVLNEC